MSIKSKALVAAAALSVVAGIGTAKAITASAATPECGAHCIEVFSRRFGPDYVETVRHGVAKVGQPTILHRASSSNPAGDLMPHPGPLVSDFFKTGMVSAEVNSHYGSLHALQLEYAPSGKASGLCVGLAKPAFQNEGLSLQPCSAPDSTVFIIDASVAPPTAVGYFAILNASTTDFTHPFAMTYTRKPPARIRVDHLRFSEDGTVPDPQLWSNYFGVVN